MKKMPGVENMLIHIINDKTSWKYRLTISITLLMTLIGLAGAYFTINRGLSSWGIHNYVSWGVAIVSFVFWIGIAHAGTLISAILYMLNQEWRAPLHRAAEAMTIFSVIVAALFPIIHTGRPWFSLYWLFPYPNQMGMWVNFSSPLVWDIFAILTYFILSLCFWYLGLIPDLAILKYKIKSKTLSRLYDFFALGWSGSSKQWKVYRNTYVTLAGIATALVISVHSIVSTDFAVTLVNGWHSTIFPPYFVVGAIMSGCAMVSCILIVTRYSFEIGKISGTEHYDKLNKIILATSLMLSYCYLAELFFAWYSGSSSELGIIYGRVYSDYSLLFFAMLFLNVVLPQLYWSKSIRNNLPIVFLINFLINIGMWLERFIIVVSSLFRTSLSGKPEMYYPTLTDISLIIGSFGLFLTMYLIFVRIFPIISIYENKE